MNKMAHKKFRELLLKESLNNKSILGSMEITKEDEETKQEAVEYGIKIGIPEKQLDW